MDEVAKFAPLLQSTFASPEDNPVQSATIDAAAQRTVVDLQEAQKATLSSIFHLYTDVSSMKTYFFDRDHNF